MANKKQNGPSIPKNRAQRFAHAARLRTQVAAWCLSQLLLNVRELLVVHLAPASGHRSPRANRRTARIGAVDFPALGSVSKGKAWPKGRAWAPTHLRPICHLVFLFFLPHTASHRRPSAPRPRTSEARSTTACAIRRRRSTELRAPRLIPSVPRDRTDRSQTASGSGDLIHPAFRVPEAVLGTRGPGGSPRRGGGRRVSPLKVSSCSSVHEKNQLSRCSSVRPDSSFVQEKKEKRFCPPCAEQYVDVTV